MTDYPIQFKECPNCGSTRRIVEEETAKEIEEGRLPEGARVPALVTQSSLFDPKVSMALLAKRQVPVLVGYYDVCGDCGCLYCCEMQRITAVVEPQMKQPPKQPGDGGGRLWNS